MNMEQEWLYDVSSHRYRYVLFVSVRIQHELNEQNNMCVPVTTNDTSCQARDDEVRRQKLMVTCQKVSVMSALKSRVARR